LYCVASLGNHRLDSIIKQVIWCFAQVNATYYLPFGYFITAHYPGFADY
jgi:hypothetical protein